MANKPFAIQGADLTLGGVNLQAGTTGVVIPGVTQATNYTVEEVNDNGDQTYQFAVDSEVVVVDAALYNAIVAEGNEGHFADYTATTDGEGYIDEIKVNGQGTYTSQEAVTAGEGLMYAYKGAGSASDRPLVPEDWITIPFYPKMRAGEVEVIGGGGSGASITYREVGFPQGEEGDTAGTIAVDSSGNAYICLADWAGDGTTTYTVQQYETYLIGQSPGYMILTIDPEGSEDEAEVTDLWAARESAIPSGWTISSDSMAAQITAIQVGIWPEGSGSQAGLRYIRWPHGSTDPTSIANGDFFTVRYTPANRIIWTSISKAEVFESYDSRISEKASDTPGQNNLVIETGNEIIVVTNEGDNEFKFTSAGGIKFPDGTTQTTAYIEQSNVSDSNIWIQTFVTDDVTDIPQVAISVEYDSDGNIIALFDHADTDPPNNRYFSVGKFSRTGNRVWTTRIAAGVNTDGWGLAVESGSGDVYITGSNITGDGGAYTQSMLTKLSASNGSIVWSRIYDFGFESTIGVVDIEAGGNVGMVGFASDGSNDYITTTKISAEDGSVIWSRKIDGQEDERAYGMAVSSIGEIVVVGWMSQLAGVDNDQRMVVVKYDSAGTVTWQKAIQFDAGYNCFGADADIDSNGNIYICGSFYIPNGSSSQAMAIFKFNSSGDKQWSRRVQGSCSAAASSIVVGPDDRLYISGVTYDPTPTTTWVVAKYKEDGLVDWQRLIVNTTGNMSFAGQSFIGNGGGSNIAVRDGYVALGGGFGDITAGPDGVHAALVQVSTDGATFAAGDWDFTDAGFSGTLDSSASDITVIEAGLTDSANETLESTTIIPQVDRSVFLLGTTVRPAGIISSLKNGSNTFTLNADGSISFPDGSIQTTAYPGELTIVGTYLIHEYSNPTELTEPTTVIIDGMSYGGGEVVTDSAFGPGSSRVTLYADSMFAMVAVNADINAVYYNGETGSDGQGNAKILSNGVSNYRGYYAQYNLISGNDPAIQQIVISKSSTMSGSNRSANTNNDDFTVTGLSGSDVVIVLNVYWASNQGPTYSVSTTVAVQQFIDLVMFDAGNGDAPRTNINDIQAAFYNNSNAIKTAIEYEEGDLLYSGFTFYESFQAVSPTGGSGTGAVLELKINAGGGYDNLDVLVSGTGYQVSDTLTVSGVLLGGSNPTNNATITVTSVNGTGGIIGYDVGGDSVTNLWPDSYIIDGNNDQYDIGNFIGTDRTRATATVTFATAFNGGEGDPTVFPTLTILSANKPISEGQWVWFDAQNKGAFINWTLELGGTAISSANQVTITSPFVTDLFGPEVYFIKTNYGSEVDNIDTNVAITRGDNQGPYNPITDDNWNDNTNGPTNTEWNMDGWGDLSNVTDRNYDTWENIGHGARTPGRELVMHDTENNKYYAIMFHSFQGGENGGAFSYTRRLINTACWFTRADDDSSGYGDEIDTGIKIVRGGSGGIYNDLDEGGWNDSSSPTGTLWNAQGWSDLTDVTTRQYLNFEAACKAQVGKNVCGVEFVMKDTINNNYYAIKFSFWGNSGNNWPGFAYTRRKIDLTKVSSNVKFADGTIQTTAITEQRLGVLPQKRVYNSGPFSNNNDRYLTLDDIGKHLFVTTSGTYIYITDSVSQEFPIGSVITIINKSGGTIYLQKDNDNEDGTIYGSAQNDSGTQWYINDSGSGNMVTLIKIEQSYDGGAYSNWMIAGTDIGVN